MSHITQIAVALTDLGAIKAACKELGLQFVKGQKTFAWWGRYVGNTPLPEGVNKDTLGKCDHAIKVPGTTWEIGVVAGVENGKQVYRLQCDYFGTGGAPIVKAVGGTWHNGCEGTMARSVNFHKFIQAYGVAKATAEAKAKGWFVKRENRADGTVKLIVTGMR